MRPQPVTRPPEPWQLGGSKPLTVFASAGGLAAAGAGGVRAGGRGAGEVGGHAGRRRAVRHAPGSVPEYDELLVSALTRRGRKLVSTLAHIWVDSPQSVAGGRELWAIPKGLARIDRHGDSATVDVDGRTAASLRRAPAGGCCRAGSRSR